MCYLWYCCAYSHASKILGGFIMANQATLTFHGAPAKRVIVIHQGCGFKEIRMSDREFIHQRFNRVRNYREFMSDSPVEIVEKSSGNLPRISNLKDGDAILLLGSGRFLDKQSYNFAIKCIEHDIPVYFIRSNSLDADPRANHSIWRYCSLTVKTATGKKHYGAPAKYFMEIPRKEDFIRSEFSDEFYALLPGMVPM